MCMYMFGSYLVYGEKERAREEESESERVKAGWQRRRRREVSSASDAPDF